MAMEPVVTRKTDQIKDTTAFPSQTTQWEAWTSFQKTRFTKNKIGQKIVASQIFHDNDKQI